MLKSREVATVYFLGESPAMDKPYIPHDPQDEAICAYAIEKHLAWWDTRDQETDYTMDAMVEPGVWRFQAQRRAHGKDGLVTSQQLVEEVLGPRITGTIFIEVRPDDFGDPRPNFIWTVEAQPGHPEHEYNDGGIMPQIYWPDGPMEDDAGVTEDA